MYTFTRLSVTLTKTSEMAFWFFLVFKWLGENEAVEIQATTTPFEHQHWPETSFGSEFCQLDEFKLLSRSIVTQVSLSNLGFATQTTRGNNNNFSIWKRQRRAQKSEFVRSYEQKQAHFKTIICEGIIFVSIISWSKWYYITVVAQFKLAIASHLRSRFPWLRFLFVLKNRI